MTKRRQPTILDALAEPRLFGAQFSGSSWAAWRVVLAGLFGLPLADEEQTLFHTLTGRTHAPTTQAREAWLIVGRRGGKSLIAALVAVFLACFRDYSTVLAPGERGIVMLIASDRRQARVLKRYVSGLLQAVPMLAAMIVRETAESIELENRIVIEIHTASFRSTRGYTVVAAILDEIAFWPTDDAASPDSEILNALRPAMATVPGALLLAISSPYARRGELYKAHRDHFGQDHDPVLVVQADTKTMNPSVPDDVIAAAYASDAASAAAEYGAQFRRDVELFVSKEAVEAVTILGRLELPPVAGVQYVAFVDPSGGSQDSMTLAIAHHEHGMAILDCVREVKPPFSPEGVTQEFTATAKQYGLTHWTGDRYAGEWPREPSRKHGVDYVVSERTKSDLYRDLLPALNSQRVELLDLPHLLAQLESLERRTGRGGKDTIDHAPSAHDDVINAAAGALVLAGLRGSQQPWVFFSEGRALGSTLVNTVKDLTSAVAHAIGTALTATDKALDHAQRSFTEPAKPVRSIESIERLDEGCRSPEEQARLDEYYAQRAARHIPSPLEDYVRRHGVFFPERDTMPTADNEAMERIRQEFNQWR